MSRARIEITNALKSPILVRGPRCGYDHAERSSGRSSRANQESLISVRNKEQIAGEGSNKSARKEPYGHLRIPRRRHHRSIYISTRRGHISERRPIYLFYPLVRDTGQRRSGD